MKHLIFLLTLLFVLHANAKGAEIYTDVNFKQVTEYNNAVYVFTTIDGTDNEVSIIVKYQQTPSLTGAISIPSEITATVSEVEATYKVTQIGNNAFINQSGITSIEIPLTITQIGSDAFYNCTGLTVLIIPDSVEVILNQAFENCSNLTMLVIGTGIKSIGLNEFSGCDSLEVIIIKATTAPEILGIGENNQEHSVDQADDAQNQHAVGSFGGITNDCVICYPDADEGYDAEGSLWGELTSNGHTMTISDWLSDSSDNYVPATDVTNPDGKLKDSDYTAIRTITSSTEVVEVARYNIAGQKINGPQKGINIVVYSDGSTKKLIEK